MCGIYGYISPEKNGHFFSVAEKVNRFRGPDKSSRFATTINKQFIEFGHARLTITGNENSGEQPVALDNFLMTYNGEVFNFDGPHVGGVSDTEFVSDALATGLSDAKLNSFNGFFAMSLYYPLTNICYLVRDRFGEKPLYYRCEGESLYFSSSARALAFGPKTQVEPIEEKVGGGVLFDEMNPATSIHQVPPGHFVYFSAGKIYEHKWYRPNRALNLGVNFSQAVDRYDRLLRDAVSIRIRDQKKVAVSLSGGVDSTLIADTVIGLGGVDVEAFTFKVNDPRFDESAETLAHAEFLKTSLNIVSEPEYQKANFHECFESLEFGSYNFSFLGYDSYYRAVSDKGIRVILEGHGPDEYLGGYPPMYVTNMLRHLMHLEIERFRDAMKQYPNYFGTQFRYKSLIGQVLNCLKELSLPSGKRTNQKFFSELSLPMVLRTFDRISMLRNVETRSPYMDYRLVELAQSFPDKFIFYDNKPKAILRQILENRGYHPDMFGKKVGFTASYGDLLKELAIDFGMEDDQSDSRTYYQKSSFELSKKVSEDLFNGVYNA